MIPQGAPDISVVIVTWNGRRHLDTCLPALGAQQHVDFEVVLVDNASTDGTVAHVTTAYPWVRIVPLAENRGFAGGNNAGVRAATGRYVALLNNDTRPDPRWLGTLRRAIDTDPACGIVTSRVVYMHDPETLDSAGDGMTRWGGAFKRGHGQPASAFATSGEVFAACGAACLLSRALFEELGGFDEDFFVSHEDVDLSYRAQLGGYRCRYVADAIVHHVGSATMGPQSGLAIFHGQRNLEWVYVKNTPPGLVARTLPGHLLYDAAAAIYFARHGHLGTFLRGKWAALRGLPAMLGRRRAVQATRRVSDADIWRQLEPGFVRLKLGEKRFDMGLARR